MTRKREPIDMSPAAVNGRIEDMRALYKLMLALREVKIVGPARAGSTSTGGGPRGS
jgi:hypothetical protein